MDATANVRCCSKLKHFLQATKIYAYKLSRTINPWKANQRELWYYCLSLMVLNFQKKKKILSLEVPQASLCFSPFHLEVRLVWGTGGSIVIGQKLKRSERLPCQCHFVHHKSHTDWHETETGLPQRQSGD